MRGKHGEIKVHRSSASVWSQDTIFEENLPIYIRWPNQLSKMASSWITNFWFYAIFIMVTESVLTNIFNSPQIDEIQVKLDVHLTLIVSCDHTILCASSLILCVYTLFYPYYGVVWMDSNIRRWLSSSRRNREFLILQTISGVVKLLSTPLVATSADSVPSSYLVRITIAPIGTTFGNLQWRRY